MEIVEEEWWIVDWGECIVDVGDEENEKYDVVCVDVDFVYVDEWLDEDYGSVGGVDEVCEYGVDEEEDDIF